jgi:peroxiredoxin
LQATVWWRAQAPLEETFLAETNSLEEALAEAFTKADALEAPLDVRLKFYLGESRKLLPDLEATYDGLVARIQANGADILVPAVGERLPDFLMTDSEGHLVDLASLLRKGPLVISFNRGPWCDYCGLELHALARAYPEIVATGGDVVSIVPETAKYARILQQTRGLPFRVLTDLDLAYALSLGLVFWVGDKIKKAYRQAGGCCRFRQRSWLARTAGSRLASWTPTSAIAWGSKIFWARSPKRSDAIDLALKCIDLVLKCS